MKRIEELFLVHRARSDLYEEYEPGSVAYVSNSSDANGVMGFVKPLPGDTVFERTAIVVSAFSRVPQSFGARVQNPPFVACGRSGNGLLVLEPRNTMTVGQLAYLAAYLNRVHGWRFTWHRQATKDRVVGLQVPEADPGLKFPVASLLPHRGDGRAIMPAKSIKIKRFRLDSILEIAPGEHHSESALAIGQTPLVSCGDENNGVVGYYEVFPAHRHCLTIAFNGRPLTSKYHPYAFAAKDDVAVAKPRSALHTTSLLFLAVMLNRERWRYSYYRKCYADKLARFEILMPVTSEGTLDEGVMRAALERAPYWTWLQERFAH